MNDAQNYRRGIINQILPYFQKDSRLHLLVCDMGFGVTDSLRNKFPGRVINCGIMEQATVGIAVGMAMAGLKPIIYSIVNFLVFRALEQIRNDIILQNVDVKLITTGVGDYFKFLGHSHCCGRDDVKIMELINMKVYDPYQEKIPFTDLVKNWITHKGPAYIRV